MLIEPAFLSVSFPLLRPNFHWWNRCCPPFFQKVYHIDLTGSAWLPLVTALKNGYGPFSDWVSTAVCQSSHSSNWLLQFMFGFVFLSIDDCRVKNCKNLLAGWLLLPGNRNRFSFDLLFHLSEILRPFVGPASPCFLCHIIFLLKLINDATLTQFHPSYGWLLSSRKFACCCLSRKPLKSCPQSF